MDCSQAVADVLEE